MITNLYVVYDTKAKMYNKPFCLLNHDIAIRAAQDLVNDINTDVSRNPHDFTMFHLGTYDDETAQIKYEETLTPVVRFHELTPKPQQTFATEPTTTTFSEPPEKLQSINGAAQ